MDKGLRLIKRIARRIPQVRHLVDERNRYFSENVELREVVSRLEERNTRLAVELDQLGQAAHRTAEANRHENLYSLLPLRSGSGVLRDQAFIRKDEAGCVVAWIPVELLFTENSEFSRTRVENQTDDWIEHNKLWENLSIMRLTPHRELVEFFRGGKTPDLYVKWYTNAFSMRGLPAPLTQEQLIEKRHREYTEMSRELARGMQSFIDSPVEARWNRNGYFNVLDGHHRVMFLYCSGCRRIPVRVSEDDYDKWRNPEAAVNFAECIQLQNRTEFYTPVTNPYFYNVYAYRDENYKSRLDHVLEFFGPQRFKDVAILDIGSNVGYYSKHFASEGAKVTAVEPDPKHHELALQFQRLSSTHYELRKEKIQDFTPPAAFDGCVFLTVFYHFFPDEALRKNIIDVIDRSVRSFIIWESGEQPEVEKNYIRKHSRFVFYHKLANTYGSGKLRELGIFSATELANAPSADAM